GGGFTRVGRATSAGDGAVSYRFAPRVSTEFVLRTASRPVVDSARVLVALQPSLTGRLTPSAVELGRSASLTGRLTPAYQGARVQVQRRAADGTWRAIALVPVTSAGDFRWVVTPGALGRFVFRAVLPAAPAHLQAAAPALGLVVEGRQLRQGDRGGDVRVLEERLAAQRADVGPVDGVFDADTRHGLTAWQKSQGLPRTGVYDKTSRARLAAPRGVVLRHPSAGRAVEIDLTKQVLYLSQGGRLQRIVDISSGNNELYESDGVTYRAFTPEGRFSIQRKINGIRVSRLGELYRPAYFVQGWAIHGSPSVPTYPASHGCIRVTNSAQDRLYPLLTIGVPVSIYRS
ncbi:MAG: hypothetical protein JWN57_529, partial [Frankiales bacterium]|nr:hypothetical protein [Frankiales bacterium]